MIRSSAISQILPLDITAEILERQYCDRGAGSRLRTPFANGSVGPALDWTGKSVSNPRDRDDPVAAVCCRAEQLAKGSNLNGKITLLDGEARPNGIHQRRLGDDAPTCREQNGKQRSATRADGDRPIVTEKASVLGNELEGTEYKVLGAHDWE